MTESTKCVPAAVVDHVAATLSRDIYLDRQELERRCAAAGIALVQWFDHADSQAALFSDGKAAWLVFRGTEAGRLRWLDIAANAKVQCRPWAGTGWVHAGYADAHERIRYPARMMADQVPSEIPLILAGHSLGGCLATLQCAWVTSDRLAGHRVAALVTFGAPKAGNRAALAPIGRAGVAVRRYTMAGDVAPLWPFLLYRHPAPATSLRPRGGLWGPIVRHSMDGYAEAVARRRTIR